MYVSRDITPLLMQALQSMPVVVLSGPRQSGKSTLLRSAGALRDRRYYTLDDATVLARARRDPEALLAGDDPITIDEAQRAPELLLVIKRMVDLHRQPGRFLLSGSANLLLLRGIAESLAGRAIYLRLGPLAWRELTGVSGTPMICRLLASTDAEPGEMAASQPCRNPIESDWQTGGFPPVCLAHVAADWRFWFTGYRQTYLERDLRDLSHVADLGLFDQFVQNMALRSAQVLNLRDVARDCGSNAPTITRWLSLLETSFLGCRLPPYFSNRVKRMVKAPKWYLTDSGLMSFLAGVDRGTDMTSHPLRGPLFETYLLQNLASILGDHLPEARLLHYRSHAGHEVDFVVETPGAVLAIEAKTTTGIDVRDVRGLAALVASEPRCRAGIVAYQGRDIRPLGQKLWAVPTGILLS